MASDILWRQSHNTLPNLMATISLSALFSTMITDPQVCLVFLFVGWLVTYLLTYLLAYLLSLLPVWIELLNSAFWLGLFVCLYIFVLYCFCFVMVSICFKEKFPVEDSTATGTGSSSTHSTLALTPTQIISSLWTLQDFPGLEGKVTYNQSLLFPFYFSATSWFFVCFLFCFVFREI